MAKHVLKSEARLGDKVNQAGKAIVAGIVPILTLAATLGPLLPATQSGPIAVGVGALTAIATYFKNNTKIIADQVNQGQTLVEDLRGLSDQE